MSPHDPIHDRGVHQRLTWCVDCGAHIAIDADRAWDICDDCFETSITEQLRQHVATERRAITEDRRRREQLELIAAFRAWRTNPLGAYATDRLHKALTNRLASLLRRR